MQESFELPVRVRDKTVLLPAELRIWGYSHRILVRNYRALIEDTENPPSLEMIKAITGSIESVFK